MPIPPDIRFARFVAIATRDADSKADSCWKWQGQTNDSGYGLFCVRTAPNEKRIIVRAHRYSWERENGPIPDGLHVLHRCDNRSCIRPSHLFLGTHQDNMADMHSKGRGKYVAHLGEAHGCAKATEAGVRHVRERYRAGRYGDATKAARELGVTKTQASSILRGKSWRHIL